MRRTEEFLIETADHCARLAQAGPEMAEELEAMSNQLMAKAAKLDTSREREDGKPAQVRKSVRTSPTK